MDISNNRIKSLSYLLILDSDLESLICLNLSQNPICSQSSYRKLVIAKLKDLIVLDDSFVHSWERLVIITSHFIYFSTFILKSFFFFIIIQEDHPKK